MRGERVIQVVTSWIFNSHFWEGRKLFSAEHSSLFANWNFHTLSEEFEEIEFAGRARLVTQARRRETRNSHFCLKTREGEFFHIGTYTRQLCHCRLICAIQVYYGGTYCYYPPGVLHVLLLGEFPKYADPNRLDLGGQIWLQERGSAVF